jgi:hypothetical protein
MCTDASSRLEIARGNIGSVTDKVAFVTNELHDCSRAWQFGFNMICVIQSSGTVKSTTPKANACHIYQRTGYTFCFVV